jgi:RHS repeat-associated protein
MKGELMTHRQLPFGHQHHHGHGRRTRRSAADEAGGVGCNHLFQGMAFDSAAGLYDFRNRAYSPALAAWSPHDPIGYVDGLNVYNVPPDDPLIRVDPLGEHPEGQAAEDRTGTGLVYRNKDRNRGRK